MLVFKIAEAIIEDSMSQENLGQLVMRLMYEKFDKELTKLRVPKQLELFPEQEKKGNARKQNDLYSSRNSSNSI